MVVSPEEHDKSLRPPSGGFAFLSWIAALAWGNGITKGGQDDGLREAITLLGFLLVWQLALLAYVQTNPIPELSVVTVYFVVSVLPLIGIFSICAAPEPKLYHRRIGFRLGMLAVVMVLCLGTSYVSRTLPGQFQTGTYLDSGNKLLGINLERLSAPSVTNQWTATLSERASRHWRIEEVLCFRDEQRKEPIEVFHDTAKATPSSLEGSFDGPVSQKYYFRIDLEEIGTEKRDFDFSTEDIHFEIRPK